MMIRSGALLGVLLLLGGCSGFGSFLGSTFTPHGDPDRPIGTAENVQRANGAALPRATPIATQPGDVWPGPIAPLPSIADIAKTLPQAGEIPTLPPVPSNITPPSPLPPRSPSPAAPAAGAPAAGAPAAGAPAAGAPAAGAPPPTSSSASQYQPSVKLGTTITTSRGPEKISGGTGNFLTLTTPGGQYGGILVPNGNGTSTIIRPDGSVETVKSPR